MTPTTGIGGYQQANSRNGYGGRPRPAEDSAGATRAKEFFEGLAQNAGLVDGAWLERSLNAFVQGLGSPKRAMTYEEYAEFSYIVSSAVRSVYLRERFRRERGNLPSGGKTASGLGDRTPQVVSGLMPTGMAMGGQGKVLTIPSGARVMIQLAGHCMDNELAGPTSAHGIRMVPAARYLTPDIQKVYRCVIDMEQKKKISNSVAQQLIWGLRNIDAPDNTYLKHLGPDVIQALKKHCPEAFPLISSHVTQHNADLGAPQKLLENMLDNMVHIRVGNTPSMTPGDFGRWLADPSTRDQAINDMLGRVLSRPTPTGDIDSQDNSAYSEIGNGVYVQSVDRPGPSLSPTFIIANDSPTDYRFNPKDWVGETPQTQQRIAFADILKAFDENYHRNLNPCTALINKIENLAKSMFGEAANGNATVFGFEVPGFTMTEAQMAAVAVVDYGVLSAYEGLRDMPWEAIESQIAIGVEVGAATLQPEIVLGSILTGAALTVAKSVSNTWEFVTATNPITGAHITAVDQLERGASLFPFMKGVTHALVKHAGPDALKDALESGQKTKDRVDQVVERLKLRFSRGQESSGDAASDASKGFIQAKLDELKSRLKPDEEAGGGKKLYEAGKDLANQMMEVSGHHLMGVPVWDWGNSEMAQKYALDDSPQESCN